MQIVRVKMKCLSVTDFGDKQSVSMQAVYSTDPTSENKAYWDATPGGVFQINFINKSVEFESGEEYIIDVTKATKVVVISE